MNVKSDNDKYKIAIIIKIIISCFSKIFKKMK